MVKVMMWSHWHPNSNGTDYWEALGIYPNFDTDPKVKRQADYDAGELANDRFEWPSEAEEEEDGFECEGPDCITEIYDPAKHDMLKSGGGSFAFDFERMG